MRDESPPGRTRFEALYAAEGRRVLAYALRRTRQPADAADVLAEVFLIAWRRLDAVPPGDEARLWLYGVARRVMANQRRGDRRRDRLGQRLAAVLPDQVVADVADSADGRQSAAGVRGALAQLSDADREVIQLTTWEGLDATQVAAVLGVPAATVRTRLHRARRRLKLRLADDGYAAAGDGRGGGSGVPVEAEGEHPTPSGHPSGDERPLVRDHEDHR